VSRARCRHPRARVAESTYCYSGPISSARENPRAHGGSCEVETCLRCGAERRTNINGGAVERGTWFVTDDDDDDERGAWGGAS
jgi:hypothetical protein